MDFIENQEVRTTHPQPGPPGGAAAAVRVFRATGLDPLRRRKGMMLALLALLPVALMLAGRIFGMERGGGTLFFLRVLLPFYHYINTLVFVFLGCSILGEGIGDRTITYDLMCPLSRTAIYAGKMLSYIVSSLLILLTALLAAYLVCMAGVGTEALSRNLPLLYAAGVMTAAAALLYGAFFVLLSLLLKRAVLVAIILTISLDGFLAHIPLKISACSPFVHLRNLMAVLADEPLFREMPNGMRIDLSPAHSLCTLIILWLVFTAAGGIVFKKKQFP